MQLHGQLDAVAVSVMVRILIFTNIHVITITLIYTVYIHELWVIVGQLDTVASSVMIRILIFANIHFIRITLVYTVYIHELWVILSLTT